MAIIQKHAAFPTANAVPFGSTGSGKHAVPQPIIISRCSSDVASASITGSGAVTPSYIAMNHLVTTAQPSPATGTISVLANGGQVIQGTPFTFSQIQDIAQTGGKWDSVVVALSYFALKISFKCCMLTPCKEIHKCRCTYTCTCV